MSSGDLWDHLPNFFDELLAALRSEESAGGDAPLAESKDSVAHGVQRLRVGLHLTQMIREYDILTDCILDEAEALGGNLSTRAFRRVLALLREGRVQRGDNRTGFGLGLPIVKQALRAHNGRVFVRNLPGKGCVFCLELPAPRDN